ncbi:MAG TPA: hypothetical protein DIT18_04885 [Pseudomonas sp.]|nr:hypothetical protein [Pseudomonas sp.]
MKMTICWVLALCTLMFFVGYYKTIDDAELNNNWFIKKYPALQMRFVNIFANDADDKTLEELTSEERNWVIDYCRYRLGINTRLTTQVELEACKER